MEYSASQPPVIKSNLGSKPWPAISTVAPWIEYVDLAGNSIAIGASNHTLSQIANTPIWVHQLGSTDYTIPPEGVELVYYITQGDGGNLVDEGTLSLNGIDTLPVAGTVASIELQVPAGIELPSSASAVKTYPIYFTPYGFSGAILGVDRADISIASEDGSNVLFLVATMTATNGRFSYDWEVPYSTAVGVYVVNIKVHIDNTGTNFVEYKRVCELYKRKEFNPNRIKAGLVT